MHFRATPLSGAFVVELEPHADERGFFARTWCVREAAQHGLTGEMVQSSISRNEKRGTLRGMHLQLPPSKEAKLVRCARGAIYDVIIDLRPDSGTYLRHFGVELDAGRHDALYIPPTFAHGFQTLVDGTEVLYEMTDFFAPDLSQGLRWDDPVFAIDWPMRTGLTIVPRDAGYPDFDQARYEAALRAAAQHSPAPHAGGRTP